jgi:phosphoribosylamine---glycine ligase
MMFWSTPNKIFNQTLKKFEPKLAEEKFVGYVDLNCIVNGNGIYPLEFTARFGYPTIFIQQEGILMPLGQFLFELAQGTLKKFHAKSGFQVGVRIVVPPFPFTDDETFNVKSKDSLIYFKKEKNGKTYREGVHIEDVKLANGEWIVAGQSGVVLVVVGTGHTMRQAQKQAYARIKNINIPHMYYRMDIGDRWFEDSDKLHNWGYLRET